MWIDSNASKSVNQFSSKLQLASIVGLTTSLVHIYRLGDSDNTNYSDKSYMFEQPDSSLLKDLTLKHVGLFFESPDLSLQES